MMSKIIDRIANKIFLLITTFFLIISIFAPYQTVNAASGVLEDGSYSLDAKLEGGTGKATITTPVTVRVTGGKMIATIEWSSPNYDYMIVDQEKYFPVNHEGNSIFEIPLIAVNEPMEVVADTTAMSTSHEITYTITIYYDDSSKETSQEAYDDSSKQASQEAYDDSSKQASQEAYDDSSKQTLQKRSVPWEMPYGYVIGGTVFLFGLIILLLYKKKSKAVAAILILILFLAMGCSFYVIYQKDDGMLKQDGVSEETKQETAKEIPEQIGIHLKHTKSMDLKYAKEFLVDYYIDENGTEYKLLTIGEDRFLVLPAETEPYEDIPEDIETVNQPEQIYLVASPVMDMFVSMDALDTVRFSALEEKSWYIESAKKEMQQGNILYAGKYSAPDYELILDKGCDLTIENTMIYHTPEVKEKLESFGIPVMVDRSSYETEPLGRMEWVKLYGALLDKEETAESVFNDQAEQYTCLEKENASGDKPTVAFFYISANGSVKVRKGTDYMAKMIEAAGGEYIFSDLKGEEGNMSSTVNMQLEEFYAKAVDADYIIYNSTIEGELKDLEDLLKKSDLLRDMKAVKNGHVYCTSNNLYQSSMEMGTITSDLHKMLQGESNLTYLYPLQ